MQPSLAMIGAGMGRLTLAAALHQRGFAVRVYEQAPKLAGRRRHPDSSNAMRVLCGIGLEHRIRSRAFQPHSWTNREWDTARPDQ